MPSIFLNSQLTYYLLVSLLIMVALFLLMPLLALYRIRLIGLGHRRNGVFLMDYLHLLTLLLLLPVSLPPLVVLKLGIDEDICAVTYFTSY